MKRVLLTGADGFIGKNFSEQLKKKYEIIPVTRNSKYNLMDLDSLLKIDNIDVVLHFAAKTFVPDSFDNPYDFYQFNMESTLKIAEFCRQKQVPKVIFLNSYTYGKPKYLPIDENHILSFHSPYNKSKYLSEKVLFNYLEDLTDVISLRLFNIYGKYQNDNFLFPTILKQLASKEIQVQDIEPKRDYLYVKDLINLLDKLIKKNDINGIYNIGSGVSYSVKEVIDTIKDVCNLNLNIISNNLRRKNEVLDCYANIDKIKDDIDWYPEYSLKNGMIDYLKEVKIV